MPFKHFPTGDVYQTVYSHHRHKEEGLFWSLKDPRGNRRTLVTSLRVIMCILMPFYRPTITNISSQFCSSFSEAFSRANLTVVFHCNAFVSLFCIYLFYILEEIKKLISMQFFWQCVVLMIISPLACSSCFDPSTKKAIPSITVGIVLNHSLRTHVIPLASSRRFHPTLPNLLLFLGLTDELSSVNY